jgi:hypothetical protein
MEPNTQLSTFSGSRPGVRMILIDADVIDQISRGNAQAAQALLRLRSTATIYISQQAFNELTSQPGTMIAGIGPDLPRTATANRLLLEELGIHVAPPGNMGQRVAAYAENIRLLDDHECDDLQYCNTQKSLNI